MNINLAEPRQGFDTDPFQADLDEHLDIMQSAGIKVDRPFMLLSDPEYPGAYRVWVRHADEQGWLAWAWVDPDGEVQVRSTPWMQP